MGLQRIIPTLEGLAAKDLIMMEPTERPCRECGQVFITSFKPKWVCDACIHSYTEHGPFADRLATQDAKEDRIFDQSGITGRWKANGKLDTFRAADQPMAYSSALDFITDFPKRIALAFCGGVGTGKTHLVTGIARKLALEGLTVKMVHVPTMAWQIKTGESWQKEASALTGPLFTADLVVLDDVGREKDTPAWTEARDAMIDRRWVLQRPTIIASNLSEQNLKIYLGDAAASRFTSEAIVVTMLEGDRRMIPLTDDAPF
jgi:DNA replication protein DnaC